ncbi:MAG: 16S rRNA (cytosine(967)-C(5))-methyltransferase RsmB [Lachnospiraceae bacterium]|nr:16S rRNA (cytosine(967)-C(5))-methyltransferase RsmB [Lachnospiraceae bacterium]
MATEEKRSLTAREAAVKMLMEVCKDKQFSHVIKAKYLDKIEEKRERALATRLFEGSLERMIELDYIIDSFSKTPVRKMKPVIAAILRMTVYQLRFMDKIPDGAACNEAVKLAKKYGFAGLSGFVNGVARSVARAEEITYPKKEEDIRSYLSVKYSMPAMIVDQMIEQYGEETTETVFSDFLETESCVTVRCMTHSTDVEKLKFELQQADVTVEEGFYSKEALRLFGMDAPERLPMFSDGAFYIQDESSMQAVLAAGLSGNESVLDLCAAPGGKSVMAADILLSRGTGTVTACDVTDAKVKLINENKSRCRVENLITRRADATVFRKDDAEKFDVVLADVPCSGLGIIGKKPDIKLFMTTEQEKELCVLQKAILKNAVQYVKPGGVLVFSTCTLNKEENMGGYEFLKTECDMIPESLEPFLHSELWGGTAKEGYVQMIPGIHKTDGFFVSRFRKKA